MAFHRFGRNSSSSAALSHGTVSMRVTMQASMTRIRHPRSEHHSVIRSCEDDLRPQLPRNTGSLPKVQPSMLTGDSVLFTAHS